MSAVLTQLQNLHHHPCSLTPTVGHHFTRSLSLAKGSRMGWRWQTGRKCVRRLAVDSWLRSGMLRCTEVTSMGVWACTALWH